MTIVVNNLFAATGHKTPLVLLSLSISAVLDILDHYPIKRAKNFFILDDIVLEWLWSYFTGYTQYVSVGGCRFITAVMTSAVPQRSVLGLNYCTTILYGVTKHNIGPL